MRPSPYTSIFGPARWGVDPSVATTVTSAAGVPSRSARNAASKTSCIGSEYQSGSGDDTTLAGARRARDHRAIGRRERARDALRGAEAALVLHLVQEDDRSRAGRDSRGIAAGMPQR